MAIDRSRASAFSLVTGYLGGLFQFLRPLFDFEQNETAEETFGTLQASVTAPLYADGDPPVLRVAAAVGPHAVVYPYIAPNGANNMMIKAGPAATAHGTVPIVHRDRVIHLPEGDFPYEDTGVEPVNFILKGKITAVARQDASRIYLTDSNRVFLEALDFDRCQLTVTSGTLVGNTYPVTGRPAANQMEVTFGSDTPAVDDTYVLIPAPTEMPESANVWFVSWYEPILADVDPLLAGSGLTPEPGKDLVPAGRRQLRWCFIVSQDGDGVPYDEPSTTLGWGGIYADKIATYSTGDGTLSAPEIQDLLRVDLGGEIKTAAVVGRTVEGAGAFGGAILPGKVGALNTIGGTAHTAAFYTTNVHVPGVVLLSGAEDGAWGRRVSGGPFAAEAGSGWILATEGGMEEGADFVVGTDQPVLSYGSGTASNVTDIATWYAPVSRRGYDYWMDEFTNGTVLHVSPGAIWSGGVQYITPEGLEVTLTNSNFEPGATILTGWWYIFLVGGGVGKAGTRLVDRVVLSQQAPTADGTHVDVYQLTGDLNYETAICIGVLWVVDDAGDFDRAVGVFRGNTLYLSGGVALTSVTGLGVDLDIPSGAEAVSFVATDDELFTLSVAYTPSGSNAIVQEQRYGVELTGTFFEARVDMPVMELIATPMRAETPSGICALRVHKLVWRTEWTTRHTDWLNLP